MKNPKILSIRLMLLVLTAVFMFQSAELSAQTYMKLRVYEPGSSLAKLQVVPHKADMPVTVSVKDAAGMILSSEYSRKGHYNGLINFSKMLDGTYYVELTNEKGLVRKTLIKSTKGLNVLDQEEYLYNYVRYVNKDKKLYVHCVSNLKQPYTIRVVDSKGNQLLEESNISKKTYVSKFNFSGLAQGIYHVQLISDRLISNKAIRIGGKGIEPATDSDVIVTASETSPSDSTEIVLIKE